ncbi:hypothetical protein CS063_13125 [Sporanaerobium hydrogeniformans]|uniref:Uncharacterized protein n=1 Tax=Sporanaerobium hydrogeniformans TaxID=3072179 RepID=A0AC61DAN3_9FIRM|nr:histidine kinase [Sporanaerobium hydrogeniformans]PHV69920.1 hypothetical protein CS063_13125 [Sporanaerobium hydrogeniformans]
MLKVLKNKLLKFIHRTSLWLQLALFITFICTLIAFTLIYKDYTATRTNTIHNHVDTTKRLLTLEVQNLEHYLQTLANYCILPCYDSQFTQLVNQNSLFLRKDRDYIKQQMYYYYYTRNDILDYQIYFLNQNLRVGRTSREQRITLHTMEASTLKDIKQACITSSYNHILLPSHTKDSFFTFYQALIRIKNQAPQALVEVKVNTKALQSLLNNHAQNGNIFLFYNEIGELIFSSTQGLSLTTSISKLLAETRLYKDSYTLVTLNNSDYLLTQATGTIYGITLISLTPIAYIDSQIGAIRKSIVMTGIFIWLCTTFFINLLIRFLIHPLKVLASKMELAGQGNFNLFIPHNGSKEIIELTDSFNSMVHHIDELIKRTYIAELSEKNAKLTALEAQLNPHFLYNTLQALSTEALMNDQIKLNTMITSLASTLRYSIKDSDLVILQKEIQYVQNYIYLQKIRMDDNLEVVMDIEESTLNFLIPKISIQTLVENSLLHGIHPGNTSIKILISVKQEKNQMIIKVKDNGRGISEEQLEKLYKEFEEQFIPGTGGGIGLPNLYVRLKLLYAEPANLTITSEVNNYTEITLTIPAIKEDVHV